MLPDNKKQIAQLERLSHFETAIFLEQQAVGEKLLQIPIILDFKLNESEAKELNFAIDLVIHSEKRNLSRSQALVFLARFYLNNIGLR